MPLAVPAGGRQLIKTELLETQTVDFSVGAEGLRHVPGDVIEICDDDYAGISTGGRVLAVNSQTRTLTLDREITLPSSGTTLISLVDGSGNPVSVEVQSVTDGVKVKVSRVPDGVAGYSVWGLKLPTLRQRLFRCVSIREKCHAASSAAPDCRSHRRQRGISGAGALGHAEGGEGGELYASPDRNSGRRQ